MIILADDKTLYDLAAFAAARLHLIDEDLEVDIKVKSDLDGLMFGYMIGDEDEYKIRISEVDAVTIFHEMVHIDQYVTGRLVKTGDKAFWRGQEVHVDVPYLERPWEVEAEAMALELAEWWNKQ
jgi:hypothetical protein